MMNFLAVRRRHPLAGFLVLALTLGVLGLAYASLSPSDDATAATSTDQSTAVEEGRELFLVGCASCHGLNGQGTDGVAPTLVGVGAAAVDFQVSTGRMPLAYQEAQAQRKPRFYDVEQTAALAAYVASLGPGPAYPNVGSTNAIAHLRDDLFRAGWRLHKTLWGISPAYRGPVLVRGRRLDRPGAVLFNSSRAVELRFPAESASAPRRWRYGPSYTAVRGPGCYGLQVDGATFRYVIVFEAKA